MTACVEASGSFKVGDLVQTLDGKNIGTIAEIPTEEDRQYEIYTVRNKADLTLFITNADNLELVHN